MAGLGLMNRRRAIGSSPTAGRDYIKFVDQAVLNVLLANGASSDGVGITREDAARLTSIGAWFRDNTEITMFPELAETGVTTLEGYAFYCCTALTDIDLSKIVEIETYALFGCSALAGDLNLPNLTSIGAHAFRKTNYAHVELRNVTSIDNNAFFGCPSLNSIILENVKSLGSSVFASCSALTAVICLNTTPPAMGSGTFTQSAKAKVYVPDAYVDAYKAASGWSSYASRIYPLSEYQG